MIFCQISGLHVLRIFATTNLALLSMFLSFLNSLLHSPSIPVVHLPPVFNQQAHQPRTDPEVLIHIMIFCNVNLRNNIFHKINVTIDRFLCYCIYFCTILRCWRLLLDDLEELVPRFHDCYSLFTQVVNICIADMFSLPCIEDSTHSRIYGF